MDENNENNLLLKTTVVVLFIALMFFIIKDNHTRNTQPAQPKETTQPAQPKQPKKRKQNIPIRRQDVTPKKRNNTPLHFTEPQTAQDTGVTKKIIACALVICVLAGSWPWWRSNAIVVSKSVCSRGIRFFEHIYRWLTALKNLRINEEKILILKQILLIRTGQGIAIVGLILIEIAEKKEIESFKLLKLGHKIKDAGIRMMQRSSQ